MDIMTIGKNVAELRKLRGVKQDELAKYVGVTAQAVSKWENGGVPDTELLPRIAEFFDVSMDELFGLENKKPTNTQDAILKDIINTKVEDRISRAFELCWIIEQSMYGKILSDPEQFKKKAGVHNQDDQVYSQVVMDSGYTEMGLFNRLQYFLVVPDAANKDRALLDGIDYPSFFKVLADRDVFNAIVFLYKRESKSLFSAQLLMKALDITEKRTKEVLSELLRLRILVITTAEVDSKIVELYDLWERPSFVSLLIFAREMIDIPNNFYINSGGRRKPFLR